MADPRYEQLKKKITASLANSAHSNALVRCMQRVRNSRAETLATLPGGTAFRDDVKAAKERCIANLPELKARFIENARRRGTIVHEAKTAADVIRLCIDLAKGKNADIIAKSKSLTTEEIELNHPLMEAGIEVVETDLGELIIQMEGEKPFHLVFPAVHKMAPDVARLFAKKTGEPVGEDIPSIMRAVRKYLRPIFLKAGIGMTGANIGIAETGAFCIETNEGNGRLVSSIGDCHICVMGMEKIVDTIEDALLMIMAHPVSASGQLPTTYVTWMHGRSPLGAGATARESHLILLDNGRSAMREDPWLKEMLYCIRCGACMNVCPTYGIVGGHTFGHIYPGPMGIGWTAGIHGLETAADFAPLCISCGLCKEICPAKIDMPHIIAEIKHRDAKTNGRPLPHRVMMGADKAARLGSLTAPLANASLKVRPLRALMARSIGLSADRALPPFSRQTFHQQFRRHSPAVREPVRKVAFFVDVYANYNAPELGMAAVRELERLDCAVAVPPQEASGYPFIAYGDMVRARATANTNVDYFLPYVESGYDIVATEPTATYALTVTYPRILDTDAARTVADHTYEYFEFINEMETDGDHTIDDTLLAGRRFGFHCSCHQRGLGAGRGAMEWLRRRGADVTLIETGSCCGMGGTFGLKTGPLGHDLSKAIGEPLFALFRESGVDAVVTESSVCRIQLAEGTGLPVYHPLELPAYAKDVKQ